LDKSASGWSAGRRDVLNAISKDAAMAVDHLPERDHDIDLQAD
jgi:hypothetical protein